MDPIYIILYVVIVAVLVTVFATQIRKFNPRLLWASAVAGLVGLAIIMAFYFTR